MIFLPTAYGLQSKNLAERLKLEQGVVDTTISKMEGDYQKSFQWLKNKETEDAIDRFGRKRDFSSEPPYKRRNFQVQSPASLVCLERLCALQEALPNNVQFSIHDGYVLTARKKDCLEVMKTAKKVLESESIAQGLKLKVSCQIGKKLNKLIKVK